jgi:GPH family glycoside/pentoside/hexuronide:cation symporter
MSASLAASLIGGALPPLLVAWIISAEGQSFMHGLGAQEIFGTWAGTRRQGYLLFAGLFGVIMVAALITTFLGTRERYVATDREPGLREEGPLRYVMQLVALTGSSPAYRLSLLIKLFSTCAVTLIGVQLAYYIQFVLEMAADKPTIMGTLFCAAIISTPLWVRFTKRRGKITAYRWAAGGYIVVLSSLLILGTGPTEVIYAVAVLAGICHAGVLIIPWTIIPDVVEFDEFESGRRREGLLYGGTTFAYKFASGLALFIAGWVLSLVGYVPDSTQTPEAVTGILMSVVAGPVVLLALSLVFTRAFPITPERHAEVVAALSARKRSS